MIKPITTDRFTFNNWIRDSRGYYNALSRILIVDKYSSQVVLTIEEKDSEKINDNIQELCDIILENIETVDEEGADFRTGMLLESSGGNSIPFTLMFFEDNSK